VSVLAIALWLVAQPEQTTQQVPTFRSSTDAVLVHVLVRQGSRSVADLKCDDFQLRDNGVVQSLTSCDYDSMPLDIAVVADTSQSTSGVVSDRIQRSAKAAVDLALPIDRVRILGFASMIQDRPNVEALRVLSGNDLGHTALVDAIATAMMLPVDAGRRRVALVLTDGLDSNSIIPKELVQGVVDRADMVLHVFAIAETRGDWMSMVYRTGERDYFWFLNDLVKRGGGSFSDLGPTEDIKPKLEAAVAEIRTRYLLRYTPQGVASQGWHAIDVEVLRSGRYSVMARKGYQRGS